MNNYTNYTNSNVKFLRENKRISQFELSKALNIDQSTLAKWENNTRQITLEWAIKLANYFDIYIGDFISKDLRIENNNILKNAKELTEDDEFNLLKVVLKRKGILNESDNLSKEDYNKLIEFVDKNKEYLIKKK